MQKAFGLFFCLKDNTMENKSKAMSIKKIQDWGFNFPESGPVIIAGPCSAETREQTLGSCLGAAKAGAHILRAGIWKPRTSPGSFEGVGETGLPWMQEAAQQTGLPTCVEVAKPQNINSALKYGIDILWIGARTTVNPFMVQELADALRGRDIPILVKNPVNPDIKLWIGAIKRLHNAGLTRIAAIHRGFDTLAKKNIYRNPPNWGLVTEFKKELPGISLINDPSHIAGKRELLYTVARKALEFHLDGFMIETHVTPNKAWSDAAQQITPTELTHLLETLFTPGHLTHTNGSTEELKSWRHEIDLLDKTLIDLLAHRKEIVEQIAKYKQSNQLPIVQFERWKTMILKRIKQGSGLGLEAELVEGIFDSIHRDSVKFQRQLRTKSGTGESDDQPNPEAQ